MHATKRMQFSGGARRKDHCRKVRRRCSCRIFQRMSPQEKSPCKLTMLKWRSDSVKCWKHVFRKRRLFHPNERRAAYRLGTGRWRKGICHRRWPAARGSGADGPCRNAVSASAIPREPRHTRQPCIFPRKKTCTPPPMAGTPMQFPQCAMPETTPANKRRLCAIKESGIRCRESGSASDP